MIFITVGNGKFEPLVKEVVRLKGEGLITEDVVIQVGHGTYNHRTVNGLPLKVH